tara:strand:+ start:479 stop:769 length:291 start_codon:yes stop_codon:yes gene_type:complete
MQVNKKVLKKLATLSKIEISLKDEEEMLDEFNKIVTFINVLKKLDTKNIKELTHIHHATNIFREDRVENMLLKSDMLRSSPKSNSDYIKVPKILKN